MSSRSALSAAWATVLAALAASVPAAAQSVAPPGSVVRNGVVSLGILPVLSNDAAQTSPAAASAPTAAAAGAASGSRQGGASAGGSAAAQPAAAAHASGVPAWLLCPPSGATGVTPFLTGTDLSCAP